MILSFILTVLAAIVALAEPWPLAFVIDSVIGTHPPPGPLRGWFGSSPDPYRLLVFIVVPLREMWGGTAGSSADEEDP